MRTRRVLSLILCVSFVLAILLTGCSGKGTVPGSASSGSAEPVKISMWTGYPELDPWLKKVVEQYQKDHTNVQVEIVSFPLADYDKKIATAVPSKSAADIITYKPNFALKYVQNDMLLKAPEDLAQLVNSGIYSKPVTSKAAFNGSVFGVPYKMDTTVALFYNTKMFKEAGLTEPPKSMDQLIEYAQKLTQYDASGNVIRSGLSLRLQGESGLGEKFWLFLMQHGGSIVKEVTPGKFKANYDNEAGLKTLQMYVDMLYKYKTDDPNILHDAEAFEAEKTAMFVRESWVIADIKEKNPALEYDTTPLFNATMEDEADLYVTNSSKGGAVDASWDFIRTIVKEDNQKMMLEMTGWPPARNDLDIQDYLKEVPQYKAFAAKFDDVHAYPMIPEYDEIQIKVAQHLASEAYTDKTLVDNPEKIKAFLAEVAKETNQILKDNGHLAE